MQKLFTNNSVYFKGIQVRKNEMCSWCECTVRKSSACWDDAEYRKVSKFATANSEDLQYPQQVTKFQTQANVNRN